MNRLRSVIKILALLFLWLAMSGSNSALAHEGFNSDPTTLPAPVAKAWGATFMLLFRDAIGYDWGTAFLVKRDTGLKFTKLYFLTNGHVVREICGNKTGLCPVLSLVANPRLTHLDDIHFRLDSSADTFESIEVVKLSMNPDLALLRVTTASRSTAGFSPIQVSRDCKTGYRDSLYAVGFSDPFSRTVPGHLPVADQNVVFKRWSQGIFIVDVLVSDPTGAQTLSGTTVDALSGGSGSPLLDAHGFVVGVLQKSIGAREGVSRYVGNENEDDISPQSFAVACGPLTDFLK